MPLLKNMLRCPHRTHSRSETDETEERHPHLAIGRKEECVLGHGARGEEYASGGGTSGETAGTFRGRTSLFVSSNTLLMRH